MADPITILSDIDLQGNKVSNTKGGWVDVAIVLAVEFIVGLIFNLGFSLALWTYVGWPFNILGQICLSFAILWFFMCSFAFWLDAFLRFVLYRENIKYSVLIPYKKLFILK